jgi:hypothetical protein
MQDECQVAVSRLSFICQAELMDVQRKTRANRGETSGGYREPGPNRAEVADPLRRLTPFHSL